MSWYDVRPLLPDELGRQRARRWIETIWLKSAIADGIAQARDEHTARRTLANDNVGRVG